MNPRLTDARRRQIEEGLASGGGESVWLLWRSGAVSSDEAFARFYRELMTWARVDPAGALRVVEQMRGKSLRALTEIQRAQMQRVRAHALRANSRLRESARHYREALERFEELGELEEAGRTAIGWIDVLSLLGEHHEALAVAKRARRRLAKADATTRARLQSNVGTIQHHLGQYRLAIASYRGARAPLRRAGHAADLALVDFNLGQSLLQIGRFREAHRTLQRSHEAFSRRGFTAQALRARFGVACATLYMGSWDEGTQQLDEIRELLAALGDEQAEAAIHWELSRVYGAFGDVESAAREARSAHSLYRKLGITRDEAYASLLHARWLIERGKGADARVQLDAARTYFAKLRDRTMVRRIDVDRAALELDEGRFEAARTLLRGAQSVLDRVHPESALRCRLLLARIDVARDRPAEGLRRVQRALDESGAFPQRLERPAIVLVGARAHALLGRSREAVSWAKRSCREVDKLAQRTGDERLRHPLGSMRAQVVREAIEIVLEHGGSNAARDALDLLSRAQSRELVEDLLRQMPRMAPGLRARIAHLREQLLRAEVDRPGDVRVRVLSRDIEHLDRALHKRLRRDVEFVRRASDAARLQTWRSRIPHGEPVVVFDHARESSSAFVVERSSVRRVELESVDDVLRRSWRPLQLLFEAASAMPAERRVHFLEQTRGESEEALVDLGRVLWEPLEIDALRVHLVLPPSLHSLPLEALSQIVSDVPGPVVSRWPHPSLIRTGVPRSDGPAVLVHDGSAGTRQEVEVVASSLREAGFDVDVDSGRGALRARDRVGIFHVAGHGSVAHGHWVGTGIQLADGWMGLEEVVGERRFRDALLFFASCGSGQRSGQEQGRFDGWSTAGLSSGARAIVTALWKIDDNSAQSFSALFYEHWCAPRDAAGAAHAVRSQLHSRGAHPYQWAPFSVVG